ncbi:unnamed protein product, partial [Oikopleura dioica]
IWGKITALLTDTCPAQLCSNKEVIEIIKKKRGDPNLSTTKSPSESVFSLAIEREEREGSKPRNKAFCTDVGSRIGADKKNSEDLLLNWHETIICLNKHLDNKRVPDLLKLLENPADIILNTAFVPLSWAAFSGPILRTSERKDVPIEDVRNQMKDCLALLDACSKSTEPFDYLVDAVIQTNKNSEYFRKLHAFAIQPREDSLRQKLNETMVRVLAEIRKKTRKGLQQHAVNNSFWLLSNIKSFL